MKMKFSQSHVNKLMKTLVITIDTREQVNDHIKDFLDNVVKVPYSVETMRTGDYGIKLPANKDLGINNTVYFDIAVERKRDISELTGNLQKANKTAFENELIRSRELEKFVLVCEQGNGYYNILNGIYSSKYKPKSLLGILNSYQAKYGFQIVYIEGGMLSAHYIYNTLYYFALYQIKKGLGVSLTMEV